MFKNRKKLVIGLTASALCITSVVGGTLAYFTDKDIRSNVVTLGHVTGTLTETDEHKRDDNTTGKDYSNVKPGDVLSKDESRLMMLFLICRLSQKKMQPQPSRRQHLCRSLQQPLICLQKRRMVL